MNFPFFVLILVIALLLIWGFAKLSIWIIKTAVKEALQEYDSEKQYGQKKY